MRHYLPVLSALMALTLGLVVSGCGNEKVESQNNPQGDRPVTGTFKVALLTPGPVSDAGWSAMAYEGLEAIKSDLKADVANQEAAGTKIRDAMKSYANEGYQLIFGHGFEYNDPAILVAKDYPEVVFVSSSGGKTADNVGALRFELEQGFYLAGLAAAKLSKSGVVGMVGGPDVPSIRSTFKAFKAGAEAGKPGIQVKEIFTGKESDVAAAKQATLTLIGQGADYIIHQTNSAAQGVFEAAKEKGVYAFGSNLDQNSNESGVVIASAVIVAKAAFLDLAKQVQAGTYKGQISPYGFDKGAIDFIWNPNLKGKVPADVLKLIEETTAKIKDGSLTVPQDKF